MTKRLLSVGLSLLLLALSAAPLYAGKRETKTVETAAETVRELSAIPLNSIPRSLLHNAAGVAVIPRIVRAGLLIDREFGRGVVLIREPDGRWSNPHFRHPLGRRHRRAGGYRIDRPGAGVQDEKEPRPRPRRQAHARPGGVRIAGEHLPLLLEDNAGHGQRRSPRLAGSAWSTCWSRCWWRRLRQRGVLRDPGRPPGGGAGPSRRRHRRRLRPSRPNSSA